MDKYEHGGDVYRNDNVLLDFSVNTNARGMPEEVKKALIDRVAEFSRYPDPQCSTLRRALALREGVDEEHIVCGNGAADLIYRLVYSIKPKSALIPAPTFSEYERALSQIDCSIDYHQLTPDNGFFLSDTILERINRHTDVVFLCHPNNPTGRLIERSILDSILEKCRQTRTIVIVDECFIDFTDGFSTSNDLGKMPHLVVLKAFTKSHALAGLRLGYMMSTNTSLIEKVMSSAQCWSVSVPAQIAGETAVTLDEWLSETRRETAIERAFLRQALLNLGLTVFPSDANYLLVESDVSLYEPLLRVGILIRRCENFRGLNQRYFRFAAKTRRENERLIAALQDILKI